MFVQIKQHSSFKEREEGFLRRASTTSSAAQLKRISPHPPLLQEKPEQFGGGSGFRFLPSYCTYRTRNLTVQVPPLRQEGSERSSKRGRFELESAPIGEKDR